MARIQIHHITYGPEWTVELNMLMHRTVSRIQSTKATPQQYSDLTNFLHAVSFEWNRMRRELDMGGDLRVMSSGEGKLIRELRSKVREQGKQNTELRKKMRGLKRPPGIRR